MKGSNVPATNTRPPAVTMGPPSEADPNFSGSLVESRPSGTSQVFSPVAVLIASSVPQGGAVHGCFGAEQECGASCRRACRSGSEFPNRRSIYAPPIRERRIRRGDQAHFGGEVIARQNEQPARGVVGEATPVYSPTLPGRNMLRRAMAA